MVNIYLPHDQVIVNRLTLPFDQQVTMAARLSYGFQQILAQAQRVNLGLDQVFDTATPIYLPFEQPIQGYAAVQLAFKQIFNGYGPPVALEFLQTWYNHGYDVALLPFAQIVGSKVETALQELQFSVTVAQVRVGVESCQFERDGFANLATLTLREKSDYINKEWPDAVVLTVLGVQYQMIVVDKPFDEQIRQGIIEHGYVLECMSITCQLSEEINDKIRASRVTASFPAGTMATILLDFLTDGVCAYALHVPDFPTGPFDFEDAERLSGLREVFPADYGWIIETDAAGVLQVLAWELPEIGSISQKTLQFDQKQLTPPDSILYNQVTLKNFNQDAGSTGSTGLRLEVVDNGDGTGKIYGYSVPWSDDFYVYDSEAATTPSLVIQGGGVEEVEIEDNDVEFVDSAASLSKPIYSAPVFDWGGNDSLESVGHDESGNLTTAAAPGYSVASLVTYITRRKVWTYDNRRTDVTQVRIR